MEDEEELLCPEFRHPCWIDENREPMEMLFDGDERAPSGHLGDGRVARFRSADPSPTI